MLMLLQVMLCRTKRLTDRLHVVVEVLAGSESPGSNKLLDHDGGDEDEAAQTQRRLGLRLKGWRPERDRHAAAGTHL